MRIKGKSRREKILRKRALHSIRGIMAERRDKGKRQAIISAIQRIQMERFALKGKPFLKMPEEKAMKKLDRRVLPGFGTAAKRKIIKATRKALDRKRYYKKHRLIVNLFGGRSRLGIIMVKPELYSKRGSIKGFLKGLGYRVVFTKNFVFGKEDILRLYPHTLADRKKYRSFAISASYMMSSPSRVIVFEHLPANSYKEKGLRESKPQDAFNKRFKDRMRETITRKNLAELGFPKKMGGEIKGLAKELDVHGFFERMVPEGVDPLITLSGIHIPDSVEVVRDARTLLTLTELEHIRKKLK